MAIFRYYKIYTYNIYTHSHKIYIKEHTPSPKKVWGFYNEILLRRWSREEDNKRNVKNLRTIFWERLDELPNSKKGYDSTSYSKERGWRTT